MTSTISPQDFIDLFNDYKTKELFEKYVSLLFFIVNRNDITWRFRYDIKGDYVQFSYILNKEIELSESAKDSFINCANACLKYKLQDAQYYSHVIFNPAEIMLNVFRIE